MKKSFARLMAVILVLAMLAGSGFYIVYLFGGSGFAVHAASEEDAYDKLNKLKSIIQIISENYKEDIAVDKLVDAAYDGVFSCLDDWSVYFPSSEEEQAFVDALSNEKYSGIGITMQKNERGECLITDINFKGPARRVGVKPNDIITDINGEDIAKWSLDKIRDALRGAAGTSVSIRVKRGDKSLDFSIVREQLISTTVSGELLDGGKTAYINISGFNLGTASDFQDSLNELFAAGAESLIIDIRDNSGGYIDEAMNAAAGLCPDGTTLMYYYKGDTEVDRIYTVASGIKEKLCDTVLLINENTASASEAFAAALQDNDLAILVGTNSYGKGVAQQIFDGNSSDYFKLSTLYFRGPKRGNIDGIGVRPDHLVYNNAGFSAEKIAEISSGIVPMNENKKYLRLGSSGLNVLAAQQRLAVLEYDVKPTGILDEATMKALKDVQHRAGVGSYGGLDFTTVKILEDRYKAYLFGSGDAQMDKAIELLK